MISEFKRLTKKEQELMFKAPALVTILIAGADKTIDNAEIKEAIEQAKLKKTKENEPLREYYQAIGASFEEDIKRYIREYPKETAARNQAIVDELQGLNDILPKLDKRFAVHFYTHLKDLAKKVAEASGGILGFMTVAKAEAALVELTMIKNPSSSR